MVDTINTPRKRSADDREDEPSTKRKHTAPALPEGKFKVLVVGDRDPVNNECSLYTRDVHEAAYGSKSKEILKNARTLCAIGEKENHEDRYIVASQLHDTLPSNLEGYPDAIIVNHRERGSQHKKLVGKWYSSKDPAEQRKELDEWGMNYGKDNLFFGGPAQGYDRIEAPYRSRNWAVSADLKVKEGFPRAAVRMGPDDDIYLNSDTYRLASVEGKELKPRMELGNQPSPHEQILVLTKFGDGYVTPARLQEMEPVGRYYHLMLSEIKISHKYTGWRQPDGPEKLAVTHEGTLTGGASYAEAAFQVADTHKLVRGADAPGESAGNYLFQAEYEEHQRRLAEQRANRGDTSIGTEHGRAPSSQSRARNRSSCL